MRCSLIFVLLEKKKGDTMKKEPLYILTYDHGGYVLWEKAVKPRLKELLEWMEKYPKLRIGLDYESFTFDEFSRCDPEVVELTKELLEKYPDRVGLGATTYGQPLSLYISEESNIRQLTYAIKTNLKYFGKTPDVYSISEFALNNQSPQMLKLCGYKACLLRSHVMGYGYTKTFDKPWGMWTGKDKTGIPAVPVYDGQGRGYNCTTLDNWILSRWPDDTDISLEDFRETFKNYSPLLASRYDDLTQGIEKITAEIEKHDDYKYVLLEDIPAIFGEPEAILNTDDNDFHSQMPWGYCGNEIFNGCREGEVKAVQGEKLNAFAVMLGEKSLQDKSEEGWKYILAAQHHDVTICGLLDLARRFIPSSLSFSEEVKNESLASLEKHFAHEENNSLLVMNPHSFAIDTWVKAAIDDDLYTEAEESEIICENGNKYLNAHIVLPALTAKSIVLTKKKAAEKTELFSFNEEILTTPYYEIKLNSRGILYLRDKNSGVDIFSSEKGRLFAGNINGSDEESDGSWNVSVNSYSAEAVFNGFVGSVGCKFSMLFSSSDKRIDCKAEFNINEKDRVGRTDITEGRPVPLTLNGHHHHDKLCFVVDLNLSESRKMYRDLPYSVAEWDGQLRLTEEYWYPDDRILVDTKVSAEESFRNITHLQGVYWIALRDEKRGLAVLNKGCMGSAVHGNRLYIPLLYSNEYMCGTKILDGVYTDEFSLLPFESSLNNVDIHKQALNYNYPVISEILEKGNGSVKEFTAASIVSDNDSVIMSSLYPENGYITARFCNFSDDAADITYLPSKGKLICETDLLGNEIKNAADGRLHFNPWEIKTVKISLDA